MTLLESVTVVAFAMGLLSAFSLPLGALTTRVWTPDEDAVAMMMAFGGGALLAALAIDLVGSALDRGHFVPLATGGIVGCLLFQVTNEIINNKGGFLRKSSTVIRHLQRRQRRALARSLASLRRAPFLAGLPTRLLGELAGQASARDVGEGETVYRHGDPAAHLYIVESGAVQLRDPRQGMALAETLGPGDAFGHIGCLTGAPRATQAVATAPTRLWALSRQALDGMIAASPALAEHIGRFIQSDAVTAHLRARHGLAADAARRWLEQALRLLGQGQAIPAAVEPPGERAAFEAVSDRIGRFPLFRDLPAAEIDEVADILIHKRHQKGETLYHRNEAAERLYIVEHGSVLLIDPADPTRRPVEIRENEVFGGFSFLTGSRHTVSAVVAEDTSVWVIRKGDFDTLLSRCPTLAAQVRRHLESEPVERYLETRHAIDPARAARWIRQASYSLASGRLVPSAGTLSREMGGHAGAPLAIWLGILLDGIPEALVIGADVLEGGYVSYSLMAGLFLSNYPEALSSSVGMRQQGMPFRRVLLMWTSLMALTGVGAAVGALVLAGAPHTVVSLLEGIAAGAMLTMIAETMMPEAHLKGGAVVGPSTVAGFLVAVFFTTLE